MDVDWYAGAFCADRVLFGDVYVRHCRLYVQSLKLLDHAMPSCPVHVCVISISYIIVLVSEMNAEMRELWLRRTYTEPYNIQNDPAPQSTSVRNLSALI